MKKVMLPLFTIGLIFGLYQYSPYSEKPHRSQLVMPTVKNIQETVTLYGEITDPSPIRYYAETVSTVLEVYVQPGDPVHAGQPLLRLEPQQSTQGKEAEAVFRTITDALESGDSQTLESTYKLLNSVDFSAETTAKDREAYTLYSTVNGIVLNLFVNENDTAGTLLPCIELCKPENLSIVASVGEDTVGKLKENMECSVSVSAFSLRELHGTVAQIYPYAKKTGLFTTNTEVETQVNIHLTDKNEKLRPGYRAAAKVILSQTPDALLIPYEAISQAEDGREYVMKYQNGIVVKQFIGTGAELADYTEVIDGLEAADLVFLEPELLAEGSTVFLETQ